MKKECVAMLLAGGQGSRLYVLTGDMAKPAVPFGGKFRIIDFPLSNCANSGIDTVGVLTQYRPLELNSYIGNGQPWELDRLDGGVHILPPYQSATGASWYKGTANAIYQNIGFVDLYDPEYVAVLSGDHIYKMDYAVMLRRHKETEAACTIAVMEVPWAEASRFGIMSVDGEDRITEFAEKPKEPKSNLASMGIYIFTWSKLREYLVADEADPASENDFGKNIIPAMLAAGERMTAWRFDGYWKDVGTLVSLWDANMDMLSPGSGLNLLDRRWPIYSRTPSCPPAYVGPKADIGNSAVAKGCEVLGEVNGVTIVDDYAHHPTEVAATLATAKELGFKRVWAVDQPFTYSRTRELLDDFARVLADTDQVVLTPIMGSREVDDGSVKSEDLAAKIPGCVVVAGLKEAADYVKEHAQPGDFVITMGCGDIYKAAHMMLE